MEEHASAGGASRWGGGGGGMLCQNILKSRGLEMLFPAFSKLELFVIHAYRKLFTSYTVSANQCAFIVLHLKRQLQNRKLTICVSGNQQMFHLSESS